MRAPIDLAGQRFARLTVLAPAERQYGRRAWLCRCDCGNESTVTTKNLRNGQTKSCGCMAKDAARRNGALSGGNPKHGRAKTSEHNIWKEMRQRCLNPRHKRYADYGGRGIGICHSWLKSFEAFLSDMGERPTSRHTLERLNNDGDYGPDNCVWATYKDQANNRRIRSNAIMLTVHGETAHVSEWSRRSGLDSELIARRVRNFGWSHEKAVTAPPRQKRAS